MAEFFSANAGTIIIAAALILLVGFIVRGMIRDKRAGRTCASCPAGGHGPCCCAAKKN